MVMFPKIENEIMLKKLEVPKGKIRMVLDTDTYNEIDDQFAVAYALASSEKLKVEAIYAAPFLNERVVSAEDGMKQSYDEIVRLLDRLGVSSEGFVYKGSPVFLSDSEQPIESDAARDLVKRASAVSENDPLYVVAIGAITNVASAILIEPAIINKIVVVWLGGHEPNLDVFDGAPEFNLSQDILSSQIMFDCGVPFIRIPCMYAASHLLTTLAELEAHLSGKNDICNYLVEEFRKFRHKAGCDHGTDHYAWAKEIWDISAIGYLINPEWVPSVIVHSPILSNNSAFSTDRRRHFMKVAAYVNRNGIFKDMFLKLSALK